MSLASAPATTILPTSLPDAARTFYGDVLGLAFRGRDADGKLLFALAGDATPALIEKPAGSQADHTAIRPLDPLDRHGRQVGKKNLTVLKITRIRSSS